MLSNISKFLENAANGQLMKYLNLHNILNNNRYGLRKGYST